MVGHYQGSVLDVPCGVGHVHGDGAIGGAVCDHVQEVIQAGGRRTNKCTVGGDDNVEETKWWACCTWMRYSATSM